MSAEESLESLGLTQMEALAYAYLVSNPSSTGYRVARGIGKPTANVYRALESLGRKGAVLQDRAATPSFRALSPEDLLARLEHDFMRRKTLAAEKLSSLQPDEGDERIYALTSLEQVLARARIVLASTRRLMVVDGSTVLIAMLPSELADARRRGARVLIRTRDLPALQDVATTEVLPGHPDTLRDAPPPPGTFPSLRMVSDAREVLLAGFDLDGDRVREAFWTRSPFLARWMHDALGSERCCARIESMMTDGLSVDEVEAVFEDWRNVRALV
jgi:HTH-type transcriptional regulator, sugar sensing transcriptional regulator